MTSATRKMIDLPWRTIFVPIFSKPDLSTSASRGLIRVRADGAF
jgi:hypothetical protein